MLLLALSMLISSSGHADAPQLAPQGVALIATGLSWGTYLGSELAIVGATECRPCLGLLVVPAAATAMAPSAGHYYGGDQA